MAADDFVQNFGLLGKLINRGRDKREAREDLAYKTELQKALQLAVQELANTGAMAREEAGNRFREGQGKLDREQNERLARWKGGLDLEQQRMADEAADTRWKAREADETGRRLAEREMMLTGEYGPDWESPSNYQARALVKERELGVKGVNALSQLGGSMGIDPKSAAYKWGLKQLGVPIDEMATGVGTNTGEKPPGLVKGVMNWLSGGSKPTAPKTSNVYNIGKGELQKDPRNAAPPISAPTGPAPTPQQTLQPDGRSKDLDLLENWLKLQRSTPTPK